MRIKRKLKVILIIAILAGGLGGTLLGFAIVGGDFAPADLQVAAHDITDLSFISNISRFRSCQGHEYVSGEMGETPSSMKHYYNVKPAFGNSNDTVPVYACFDGVITKLDSWEPFSGPGQGRGQQFELRCTAGISAIYFHVNPFVNVTVGAAVRAGDHLGYADTRVYGGGPGLSNWDIAFRSGFFAQQYRSYFDVMSDAVFAGYSIRGVTNRTMMNYTAEERAANHCPCGTPDPNQPEECRFSGYDPADIVPLLDPP